MFSKKNKVFVYIAIILAAAILFTGCGLLDGTEEQPAATPKDLSVDTLIIGYSEHFTTLNPFFADNTTNVDMDIVNLTQVFLLDIDNIIENKNQYSNNVATIELITAPTVSPAATQDITPDTTTATEPITTPEPTIPARYEGTAAYRITLKEDLFTAEGKKLTIDDLIFNMYVMCDVSYDGLYQFGTLPIKGISEYRYGYNLEVYTKYAQIAANIMKVDPTTEDLSQYTGLFTEEQFTKFWNTDFETACTTYMNKIVEQINSERIDSDSNRLSGIALAMYKCGLAHVTEDGKLIDICMNEYDLDVELPDEEAFVASLKAKHGYEIDSIEAMYGGVSFVDVITEIFVVREAQSQGDITNNNNISGINKLGTHTMELILDSYSPIDWLYFVFPIMPMEYYGNAALYDYENNSFGFTKGDISAIRKCDKYPLGAGPYKYEQTADGMIRLTDNIFYTGDKAFDVKTILMYLNDSEDPKYMNPVAGIIDGTYDACMIFESQEGYENLTETDKIGVREATGYKLVFSKERVAEESVPAKISDYTSWLRQITNIKMK